MAAGLLDKERGDVLFSAYGWRSRLGCLLPSANRTAEPELYQMRAPGVSFHFGRVPLVFDSKEELERVAEAAPVESRKLADAEVDAICLTCTAASFYYGGDYDLQLARSIAEASGSTATSTASAVVGAMRALNIRRVSVLSPYPDFLNDQLVRFLRDKGIEVATIKGLSLETGMDAVSPGDIYRLALDVAHDSAEGLFISCTDFPSLGILESLENDLGKPIVTSNQATAWLLYQIAGVDAKDLGARYGQLWQRGARGRPEGVWHVPHR